MNKHYHGIYFFVAIIISLYSQLDWTSLIGFFYGSLATFIIFVGIYFCLKNFLLSKILFRIVRLIGVAILLGLIYMLWIMASFSGITSGPDYNLVAKDIFTGKVKIYANYPPWHTKIIGGEEARKTLLDRCERRSKDDSRNCDYYKNAPPDKDWTRGRN